MKEVKLQTRIKKLMHFRKLGLKTSGGKGFGHSGHLANITADIRQYDPLLRARKERAQGLATAAPMANPELPALNLLSAHEKQVLHMQ